MHTVRPERPQDRLAAEALIDRAFGPGRHAKVSQRVREFARARPDLCRVAETDGVLVGAVWMSDVEVGGEPVAFLGPIAVDPDRRSGGVGAALVRAALDAAHADGCRAVLLVGDPPYFALFGFEHARDVVMPGPVDPRRVLARVFDGAPLTGAVTAPRATTPAA